jgi:hypothetical protein
MYYRLPYVSRGVLPLKTPTPLYICTSIKQYNHLTFGDTPLSNYMKAVPALDGGNLISSMITGKC